jgi:hypothetical protein
MPKCQVYHLRARAPAREREMCGCKCSRYTVGERKGDGEKERRLEKWTESVCERGRKPAQERTEEKEKEGRREGG